MLLGDMIKKYREENKLSLQDFAERIGTSRSYIHMLEKNVNPTTNKPINPSVETLKLLAHAMNRDLKQLLAQLDDEKNIYLDEEEYRKQFMPSNTMRLLENYNKLNDLGKQTADIYVEGLTEILKYTEKKEYRANG